ncbi:MAG: long-chain fatty acid--CoA ligase [Candidatus Solincola sediminis]|uniref:Long-chain fatty acid--CoA ligase n=1 Tax=Candidatus Solincola sediminis TaxID=1797199 RepID=A0A1F2WF32_9ACTN|nr:MAG: long-chain fatty acid--CoA ligase [Candidatus Solincola sediminis]OFW57856.1 MAG: long-chain fatty acid--CoA ligase [Candidatus Solincola sediminis]
MDKIWLKNYPAGVPPEIEVPDIDMGEMLGQTVRKYPTNTAIAFINKNISYRELDLLSNRFADTLKKLGVGKGDRVALLMPNIPQMVIAYFGILKLGAVVVMFNPLYSYREIEHQLNDCGAKVMVILDRFWPAVSEALETAKLDHLIITRVRDYLKFPLNILEPLQEKIKHEHVEIEEQPQKYGLKGMHKMKDLMGDASDEKPQAEINPTEDLALLQYTGGTTGVAKGAMLTHRNLVANTFQCRAWFPEAKEGQEVTLCSLPFFHVYGLTVDLNSGIQLGSKLVLIPDPRNIPMILAAVKKERPTLFPGVPAMYVAIMNEPDVKSGKVDITSIRFCLSGAAPLPMEVQREFERVTGGKLVEGFGLTEASPVTHANPLDGIRKQGSIGMPVPETEIKLVAVDDRDREVGVGEIGELVVKGPQVMKGYWNMSEETEMVLIGGWLYTGDIARADEDGFFYIVDRKKDMIIASGYNVYPRDVEEVLFEHPKVADVAVAGVPDPKRGETVKAYIVLKEGESATQEEIIAFCQERMSKYKVPTIVEFRKELPKTPIGKVLRRQLIEEEKQKLSE